MERTFGKKIIELVFMWENKYYLKDVKRNKIEVFILDV